ncbi:MAG: DUF3368 domain-containing protein [Coleofasciculaceae cyanobacterium SM2_1_6]|nr:DUF3368 domain-containing protein [Coleofasciculaceae cyanobacterium SM2_1_6]
MCYHATKWILCNIRLRNWLRKWQMLISQVIMALKNYGYAAILDDRAAWRCSQTFGISTIGTGRLLILAKQRGLIPFVFPRIQALRDAGLWLSDDLVNLLKQQAGE